MLCKRYSSSEGHVAFYRIEATVSVQTERSIDSNGAHLVDGILTGGKQVLVGATAHVKQKFVSIANLDQEARSNLQTALSGVTLW